jgi:hypothetical protein
MLRASYLNIKTDSDAKLLAPKRLHLSLLFAFTLHNFNNGYDVRTIPASNNFANGIQLEFDEFGYIKNIGWDCP